MKYRKKPVIIDAIQYTGSNGYFIGEWSRSKVIERAGQCKRAYLQINTLEGWMTAIVGDWIIKGIKGEFYPCKPDIFEATYEVVE